MAPNDISRTAGWRTDNQTLRLKRETSRRQSVRAFKKTLVRYAVPRLAPILWIQAVSTVLTVWAAIWGDFAWHWWAVAGAMYFTINCVGHEVGFHRLLSHRAFEAPKWVERLVSIFGAMGGTGSPLAWVEMHRQHHAHTDGSRDPHSPHVAGWRVFLSKYQFDPDNVRPGRLGRDRFHLRLHRYYYLFFVGWLVLLGLISPTALLFIAVVPVALHINSLNLTNFFGHTVGYRNFETDDRSVNNPVMALLNFGVGWHNNHHNDPNGWDFGVKWWEFDMSSWVIRMVRTTGPAGGVSN